jgi:CDP-glucose 4,6-dehydratase
VTDVTANRQPPTANRFWTGRRVFVTGHTGFKGAWLVQWLRHLGAEVTGYALAADTTPSLFEAANVAEGICSILADVRDPGSLSDALADSRAEVVFHLAAQSLVRESYARPVDTYATNVMGTVNVLEAVRTNGHVRAVVVVTSDKCYENREWAWAYRENEALGGHDPYSSSKACAELVTGAYRDSFFGRDGAPRVASARAGNVIGGGDWAADRLVPDLVRAFERGTAALIRNPAAIRPWQHVLEPLHGYLMLAEALVARGELASAWNFGPWEQDVQPVRWVADRLASLWGDGAAWQQDEREQPHEAMLLKVDSTRARTLLGWRPRLSLQTALEWIVEWQKAFGAAPERAAELTLAQIARFESMTA